MEFVRGAEVAVGVIAITGIVIWAIIGAIRAGRG